MRREQGVAGQRQRPAEQAGRGCPVPARQVYLGEVERGGPPRKRERWADLVRVLGNCTVEDLERQLMNDRPIQMNLADATTPVREFGLALARKIRDRDLDDITAETLMRILSGGRVNG